MIEWHAQLSKKNTRKREMVDKERELDLGNNLKPRSRIKF